MRQLSWWLVVQGLAANVVLAAPAQEEGWVLEDATVTARQRPELSRDVPVALTVLEGEQLEERGLVSTSQLAQRIPSLMVSVPNPRYASYGIRGLGSSSYNDGLDGSVGVFMDGIYLGRQGMSVSDQFDLERIEVLRGPQGTLYGKNTTAGTLNLYSRAPTFAPEATAEVTFGEHGLQRTRGALSGPLVEGELAGRLSLQTSGRDAFTDNQYPSLSPRQQDQHGARGQLLWQPADGFTARLIVDHARQREDVALVPSHYSLTTRRRAAYVGYPLPEPDPKARRFMHDRPTTADVQHGGTSLELNWTLASGATLTSLTGYRDWRYDTELDADNLGLAVAQSDAQLQHRQFSQEWRLAGSHDDRFEYVVGAYYLRQHLHKAHDVNFGPDAPAYFLGDRPELQAPPPFGPIPPGAIPSSLLDGARQRFDSTQRSDSRALFGQFTWHLTPRLAVTPGLRYTRERKRARISRRVEAAPLVSNPLDPLDPLWQLGGNLLRQVALGGDYDRRDQVAENNLSGQLTVSYAFSETVLGYLSGSRGYKAGGINLDVVSRYAQPTFEAERATSVEMGIKRSFWQGRGWLDLTLYQTDVDDYQALANSPPADEFSPPLRDNLINVGKVRLRGVELDARVRATESIQLRGGIAWSDARYRDFSEAPCAPGSTSVSACDLSGQRLFNAPEWGATVGLDYSLRLGDGMVLFGASDYSFRSGFQGTLEGGPGSYQGAYAVTDLRIGVGRVDRAWEAELWVRNLFDEHYITAVRGQLGAGDYGVALGEPRMLGTTLRVAY
ncbi:TonB-dependent receptor [Stutzerimonas azotifigens]|uniref:TonB-dependent receptor n=1 Tax=Stutzerimonas azotifigens TaxID=291995 RepID=A0ABR5Z1P7_9GAMM|nr:TonB-dependent receptor [Stutzerimonas azotifigens]MBA1274138.1 TonB-dependent receptor [Stutzerimonas azotifigens]